MSETVTEAFVMANRAFDLFTLAEREKALMVFAELRYPSIADRFFEAVHSVIEPRRVKQQCPYCKEWCAHGFCGRCCRFLAAQETKG